MPGSARIDDLCTGHGCWPTRRTDQGSPDSFVNNRASHRQYDHWVAHCCPDNGCHDSFLATGSATHFINGVQAGRIFDPVACGSIVATGSADNFIGPEPGVTPDPPELVYYKYFRAGTARAGDRLLKITKIPTG